MGKVIDFNTYKIDKEMTPYQRALEEQQIAEMLEERMEDINNPDAWISYEDVLLHMLVTGNITEEEYEKYRPREEDNDE